MLYNLTVASAIGTPHRVSQDDKYNGYLIPADSTIMANQWCHYLFSSRNTETC